MATYNLTAAQLRGTNGEGILNSFEIPAIGSFSNIYSTEYDGVDDYINCGTPSNLNFSKTDTFSFSVWYKRNANDVTHVLFSKHNPTGNRRGYYISVLNDNTVTVVLRTNTSFTSQRLLYKSTNTITDTNWHHIVFTYDGGVATSSGQIYIDGVAETMDSSGGGSITLIESSATTPFLISGLTTAPSSPANGNIDEVAVFNTELSASDVSTIYNGGTPNNLNNLSTPPLSWWRFEEGSGTTAADSGTGGNNGTLVNGPTFSTDVPT